jgi:hypothetical protein
MSALCQKRTFLQSIAGASTYSVANDPAENAKAIQTLRIPVGNKNRELEN